MNILSLIQFYASPIAAATSFLALLVTVYSLIRSRSTKVEIHSRFNVGNNRAKATIRVVNVGQRRIVVDCIRFPLTVWSEGARLESNGFMKFLRIKGAIMVTDQEMKYVSDAALYCSVELPTVLEEGDPLNASINLDAMMENFIASRETLINAYIRLLYVFASD